MRFPLRAAAWLSVFAAAIAAPDAAMVAATAAGAASPDRPAAIHAQFDSEVPMPGAPPQAVQPVPELPPPAPNSPRLRSRPTTAGPAQVYLLRGFMNMFSLGMDDLAVMIRARGMSATVLNHADAAGALGQITSRYAAGDRSSVILVGHSLGADAVIAMAQALDRDGIAVALAVLFDGTAAHAVPRNVARAINFTRYFTISPGPGFTGSIENVDLRPDPAIDHLNIDKSPALQARVMDEVMRAAVPKSGRAARRR